MPVLCICGKPADPQARLHLTVIYQTAVGRVWGGARPDRVTLCYDCMWVLENEAGNAVAAKIAEIKSKGGR